MKQRQSINMQRSKIVQVARRALVILGMSSLVGCGYSFQGSGSVLPPDVTRVTIPRVQNSSTESGLSQVFAEALRDQFERYGVITVVDGVSEADAILNATIVKVSRATSTVTGATSSALQQDLTMTISAELRRVSGQLLWADSAISVLRPFGVSGNVVVTSSADFSGGGLSVSDLRSLDSREVSRGQEQDAFQALARGSNRNL